MSRKPSGENGFTRVTNKGGEIVAEWHPITLSTNKADLECQIMTQFQQTLAKVGRTITFEQNTEDDLDFTITEASRTSKIDLVEALITDGQGNPYVSREQISRPFVFAQQIMNTIRKKSRHYAKSSIPLDLLIHETHWRFTPSSTTIGLCQHWLQREPTVFENIWFFEPLDTDSGYAHVLAPIPNNFDPLGGKKPVDFEDNVVWTADPKKWIVLSSP